MGRPYKKAKVEEVSEVVIAPDQLAVQNDEGEVIVIAQGSLADHISLGWIPVVAQPPVEVAPVSEELPPVE